MASSTSFPMSVSKMMDSGPEGSSSFACLQHTEASAAAAMAAIVNIRFIGREDYAPAATMSPRPTRKKQNMSARRL